jgi:hypothetical protein
LRGHPELAREIPRESIKGSGPRRGARALGSNPNLYEMSFLPLEDTSSLAPSLLSASPVPLSNPEELCNVNVLLGGILEREHEGLQTPHHWVMMLRCCCCSCSSNNNSSSNNIDCSKTDS